MTRGDTELGEVAQAQLNAELAAVLPPVLVRRETEILRFCARHIKRRSFSKKPCPLICEGIY
jgi:hypothetical protein